MKELIAVKLVRLDLKFGSLGFGLWPLVFELRSSLS